MIGLESVLLQVGSFGSAQTSLLPLVFAALLLDAAIVAIWYMIASVLRNQGAKSAAMNEAYQLAGTAILTMIIIGVITLFGTLFLGLTSSSSPTAILSQQNIETLCGNIMQTTYLQLLGKTDSILAGTGTASSSSSSGTFPGFCNIVAQPQTTITTDAEYPLAATGVVLANMTNQTATNLNNYFIVDNFIGFLVNYRPSMMVCVPGSFPVSPAFPNLPSPLINPATCFPIPNPSLASFYLRFEFKPFAGFDMIYGSMTIMSILLDTSMQVYVAQMIILAVMIFAWPYLIFGGLVLRSTFFTRKLGGLLIAVAIGIVIFYPTVFAIEYLSMGNGLANVLSNNPTSVGSTYGFNSLDLTTNSVTQLPGVNNPVATDAERYPNPITDYYNLNFYVMPSISTIAQYYDCWPGGPAFGIQGGPSIASGDLLSAEASDVGFALIPGTTVVDLLYNFNLGSLGFATSSPNYVLPYGCPQGNIQKMYFSMINAYGIMGVTTYFLPLINLIIVISAIIGLSGLLGGDTSLAGLSRLV